MQGLIKRTPECALHVHVGVPDTTRRSRRMNGHARAAAAARTGSAPTRRSGSAWTRAWPARARRSSARIRAAASRRCCAAGTSTSPAWTRCALGGGPTDHTMVWWDARPQPRLGTVELRELDVQTDLEQAAAIAALVRAVARRAVEEPRRATLRPAQALHWSSFRAARDGLDAEMLFRRRLRARCARRPGAARRAARGGRRARGRRGESCARAGRPPASEPFADGGMAGAARATCDETARPL